ncbi:MAG: hypothetical protein QOH46_2831 [Solirubrobacteraceae bacterium]|nr:hypothetical protein [Solirubrobacteraceae bacterium]
MRYEAPEIRDLGRVSVLTAYDGAGLHFSQAAVGSLTGGGGTLGGGGSSPNTNTTVTPPTSGGVLNSTQTGGSPTAVPGSGGVEGLTGSPASGSAPTGAEAGSNGVGSGGESLPFTGLAVGPIAALGAGLATAGATLRRWTRRA